MKCPDDLLANFLGNGQMLCIGYWSSGDFLSIFPYAVLK
jgi:hypothetical protein